MIYLSSSTSQAVADHSMAGNNSPCASCKLLRRRCAKNCIFSPFFPSDDPHKFAIVHKVFGASNVGKMLQELPIHQRADAVTSLVYEATARMRDPVYGCVGTISYLQNQVSHLQMQVAVAQAEILCVQMQQADSSPTLPCNIDNNYDNVDNLQQQQQQQQQRSADPDDGKTFLISNNLTGLPQFINFKNTAASSPSSTSNVESLWA